MSKRNRDQGFTLAELLIVVAIIGVLVAISIPIFSGQLEKAREATDAANIRSQYAEVIADAIMNGGSVNKNHATYEPVQLKQQKNEWQNTGLKANLEGVFGKIEGKYPKAKGTAWVEYDAANDVSILHYEGGSENTGGNNTDSGSGSTSGSGTAAPPKDPPASEDTGSKPGNPSAPAGSLDAQLNASAIEWSSSIKSITEGHIYVYDGNYYIALISNNQLDPNSKSPKDGWSQAYYCKLTGKVFSLSDFDQQRYDVNAGDACKVGDVFYIYKDGGNVSSGPKNSSWQWIEMIE